MSEWSKDQDQPAMTLAAIRWYAMTIERMSTEIYITNPSNYPQLQQALNDALSSLEALRAPGANAAGTTAVRSASGVCPPGFRDCDGVCLPKCPPPPL